MAIYCLSLSMMNYNVSPFVLPFYTCSFPIHGETKIKGQSHYSFRKYFMSNISKYELFKYECADLARVRLLAYIYNTTSLLNCTSLFIGDQCKVMSCKCFFLAKTSPKKASLKLFFFRFKI